MYVERKGGEEEALVPEEEHAEFVKLGDEGEPPEPEPTHTPMTWTKLAYCSALLALLITIPCVLYPPSELAKYWYGPLMGLASTIPSAGAPVAGGIVFFPILMLAGFSPSEAVAYAAATQMIGVGLFVPGSFIVYEAYAVFLHDILFWGTFSGGIGVSLTLFVFERVLRRIVFSTAFDFESLGTSSATRSGTCCSSSRSSSSSVWKSNLQPDFNVSVCFDTSSSAVLRELNESHRFVQKSAESTSI